ncbi:hypothetical protein [Streptomyces californicus]|uniref:hypothetical protein n=1 Tax=Streptomyces californicus TaxID=67351 RepID=UPI00368EAA8C
MPTAVGALSGRLDLDAQDSEAERIGRHVTDRVREALRRPPEADRLATIFISLPGAPLRALVPGRPPPPTG